MLNTFKIVRDNVETKEANGKGGELDGEKSIDMEK